MRPLWLLLAALISGTLFAMATSRLARAPGMAPDALLAAASGVATLAAVIVYLRRAGRAHHDVRVTQEFFREFFMQGPVMFHSIDPEGRLRLVNDTWVRELGYARHEPIGRPIHEFMTPASAAEFNERFPLFKERGTGTHDYRFVRKDGTEIVLRISAIAVRDAGGGFLHSYTAGLNVTRETSVLRRARDHARELEILSDALDQATRFKTEFLANQAHELRTPINAVIGFSELLRDEVFGPLNDKQKEYVGEILTGGRYLVTVINNVMDLSRIEAGSLTLQPQQVDLMGPLAEALAMLQKDAAQRRIRLRAMAVPGVIHAWGDPDRLRQVYLNLISNALRFTPEGGVVEVTAELSGDWSEMRVRDTGVGIAAADQARIFAPFVQVGVAQDPSHRGAGLGLAIVKTLVELHGGSISVDSDPGRGATFTVRLPATRDVYHRHARAPRSPEPADVTRT